jgi:Zn-dependent peptidase ImmA (M78 family)/transcriptional regulator with XRE-family HTH domain
MGKRIEALIEPSLLAWARQSAGYEIGDVAKKVKKNPGVVEDWEAGRARPSVANVRTLAEMFHRPLAVFYLSEPPKEANPPKDFRRMPDTDTHDSPEMLFEFRLAQERAAIASNLAKELDEKIAVRRISVSIDDDPEELGPKIRKLLAVTMDQQRKWEEGYVALNAWRNAVESLGVLVFQTGAVELDEMRGFSISSDKVPVIVLNSKDHPNGRIFTLLHELGHVFLNGSGVCNPLEAVNLSREDQKEESFCNGLAAAVLIPSDELLKSLGVADHKNPQWSVTELNDLANIFSVSPEATLRRLLTLGKTTEQFYSKQRVEFLKRYASLAKRKSSGGPSIQRRVVSRLGTPFVNLILRAYDREVITSRDLSQYFGTKVDYLPRIERELEAKQVQKVKWE